MYVAGTVLLTVYGQLIVKWQVDRSGSPPAGARDKLHYLLGLFTNPWIMTALLAAVLAAGCWMLALGRLRLSLAYPFVSLSFVLVLIASALLFGEGMTAAKVGGIVLVLAGLIVGSQ